MVWICEFTNRKEKEEIKVEARNQRFSRSKNLKPSKTDLKKSFKKALQNFHGFSIL
jgi:hypothetical protein